MNTCQPPADASEKGAIEAALEIARELNQKVDRLCRAVLSDDYKQAKVLSFELLQSQSTPSP